jgi:hypothetical protein
MTTLVRPNISMSIGNQSRPIITNSQVLMGGGAGDKMTAPMPRMEFLDQHISVISGNQPVILILYVDDLFLTRDEGLITWCKRELISEFEMKDLGLMHYFLGLEVWQRQGEIFLAQGKYTMDVLKRFGMMDCKSMSTLMVTNPRKLHDSDSG